MNQCATRFYDEIETRRIKVSKLEKNLNASSLIAQIETDCMLLV